MNTYIIIYRGANGKIGAIMDEHDNVAEFTRDQAAYTERYSKFLNAVAHQIVKVTEL